MLESAVMAHIDTGIHNMMMFRLLFGTQTDHFDREWASSVVEVVRDMDNHCAAVTLEVYAIIAEGCCTQN